MNKIVFDDIFFSISNSGIARYWRSILTAISRENLLGEELEIIVLNRSDQLTNLGFKCIDFPKYDFAHPTMDSYLLGQVCKNLGADLFVSSYYTTAIGCRNLGIIYDLIPEKFGFSEQSRGWLERSLNWHYSSSFMTISQSSKRDFLQEYGLCSDSEITICYPGIDMQLFKDHKDFTPSDFIKKISVKPYFITVGARHQEKGYKNGNLIIEALERSGEIDLNWIMVGGEEATSEEIRVAQLAGIMITKVSANDIELAYLLRHATCLVYPSLYEGFGIPPLEALAVGTPTIVCSNSSLSESVSNLGFFIGGDDCFELSSAIRAVQDIDYRTKIKKLGPAHAEKFAWSSSASIFLNKAKEVIEMKDNKNRLEIERMYSLYNEKMRHLQA